MPKRAVQLWQSDGKLLGYLPDTAGTLHRALMALQKSKSFSSLFSELMLLDFKFNTVPKPASPGLQLGHAGSKCFKRDL